jgi:hypothetical protein
MNNKTVKESVANPFNREKMIVNGYNGGGHNPVNSDDPLDIPTFLRRQMD